MKQHCIVITCFDENQPGYMDFLYRMRALSKAYRLTVISQQAVIQEELLIQQAQYHCIPHRGGKLGWLNYLWKSAAYARQAKADVVVLLHSALAPVTLLLGNMPHCLYWNEHPTNLMHMPTGLAPIRQSFTWLLQQLIFFGAKQASVILPIGEDHQADLLAHGVSAEKMELQYMGVADHFARASQQPISDDEAATLKLVYTGTVSAARGRDVMLEAMHLVITNSLFHKIHLRIVGASEQELAYCQQKIEQLNLQDHVEVIGRIPGDEVYQYLQMADAAICIWQPNTWNMFNPPTKLFEYLVAGLPVLASNIRTHTRYIEHGETGYIFDYHAQGLADAIQTLNQNKERLPTLKAQARHAGQRYVWSKLEAPFIASVKRAQRHAAI
ncbi:MAG: glycosyltransferase family 4 protein [Methylophilus sp.]|nr:glycosyltransferase family 4 protein [Methylophilus sp.]